MTLYEITGDYLRLMEMLEDGEEIDQQTFLDTLEGIEGEFEIKADNYARIIKELLAESEKYAAEIERMLKRRASLSNNADRLKEYLYKAMKLTGKTKFKTDLFSFGIQKNGGKCPIERDPNVEVPREYCMDTPDTKKIREALEDGVELPFARLLERGEHLSIK